MSEVIKTSEKGEFRTNCIFDNFAEQQNEDVKIRLKQVYCFIDCLGATVIKEKFVCKFSGCIQTIYIIKNNLSCKKIYLELKLLCPSWCRWNSRSSKSM